MLARYTGRTVHWPARPTAPQAGDRPHPDGPIRRGTDSTTARHIVCEVDALPHLVELVTLGIGVSLLPAAAIRIFGGRAIGIATDPPIPRELLLVTPLDHEPSPAGAAFSRLLDDHRGHNNRAAAASAPVLSES